MHIPDLVHVGVIGGGRGGVLERSRVVVGHIGGGVVREVEGRV